MWINLGLDTAGSPIFRARESVVVEMKMLSASYSVLNETDPREAVATESVLIDFHMRSASAGR